MKFRKFLSLAMLGLFAPALVSAAPPVDHSGVTVGEPVTPFDIPVDLRQQPKVPEWRPGMPIKEAHKRQFHAPNHPDASAPFDKPTLPDRLPELQKIWDDAVTPEQAKQRALEAARSMRVSINNGNTGVSPGDPVVDVSSNYIVYGVNSSSGTTFTVYDKTGTKLAGPTTFSSLAPSGDGCHTSVSDPIVLYDRLADRWFLLEMGGTSSAPKNCVYISKTNNPVSGGWWFYGFSTPSQNDYPHCGVWTDAYTCSDNEGGSTVTFYAFDRANMLLGNTARGAQRFSSVPSLSGYGFQALTPATFIGTASPPAGTKQILARHDDDEAHAGASADGTKDFIDLYSLNLDWTTPANSGVTTLSKIAISEFNSWFTDYSTFATVPQPGSTSKLDPIREVIFNSMTYRNMGTYETIAGDFATNINTARSGSTVNAGIRWFELRKSGSGGWTLFQEGTFGPGDTSTQHLEGAIATDKHGNLALGYNVARTTSPVTYASLGWTGHMASDSAGVMTLGENSIVAGSAAETSGRWGDYYSMVVDPTDDCTFWYVGMYRPATSWQTRIQDFKFSDCTTGGGTTYSISGTVTNSSGVGINGVNISNGSTSTTTSSSGAFTLANLANATYTITPSLSGYSFSPVNRSVTVNGANVTAQNFTGTAVSNIPPTANFSFTTNGLTANFTDSSTDSDGTIASRSWNFGDGSTSTTTSPSHAYAAAGTYSVALTVTDNGGATNTKTQSVTVTVPNNVLQNGVGITIADATVNHQQNWTMAVPAGATGLSFTLSGGTGDADMYVKFGSAPTLSSYDCRPYVSGNSESCPIATVQAGTYYVMVNAYAAYSGVTLKGSYTAPGTGGTPTANFTFTTSGLTATFTDTSTDAGGTIGSYAWTFGDGGTSTTKSPSHTYAAAGTYSVTETVKDSVNNTTSSKTSSVTVSVPTCGGTVLCSGTAVALPSVATGGVSSTYTIDVPAGKTSVVFTISGGTGDADLYVKLGSAPTSSSYGCRPYLTGNSETCTFNSPTAGTYYVNVRAYAAYSGVSLKGTISP